VRDEIAHFYLTDMRGRPRHDGPGARMKFTRDWEYPWTFLRAEAGPHRRLLDCGAGYSPLPFVWAARGAAVHAVDRDAVVASPARYLSWCAAAFVRDLTGELGRRPPKASPRLPASPDVTRRPVDAAQAGPRPPRPPRPARGRLARFVRYHAGRNRERLSRLRHPDFWGPVSPALLRRYAVRYVNGDLTQLPFAARTFDAVSCVSVLEHMPPEARTAGVREMARVARPGGRLIITYDVVDGDITDELVDAANGTPVERVYFHASERLYASGAPDVIGVVIAV
jgi:SAM-dependent methyltransferase